jgi:hypothetical protein
MKIWQAPILTFILSFALSASYAQNWARVGTGANGTVYSLNAFSDGLSVAGAFTQINSFNRINHCLIRENFLDNYTYFFTYADDFNTNSSSTGTLTSVIRCVEAEGNNLHVGGQFLHPKFDANVGVGYLEIDLTEDTTDFDGYASQIADSQTVYCMKTFEDALFIGGDFQSLNGNDFIAQIDLTSTSPYTIESAGMQITGSVYCLEEFNGTLYAGGEFHASDTDTVFQSYLAQWNGTDWKMILGGLNGPAHSMTVFDDKLIIGGAFTEADSVACTRIVSWDGTGFESIGMGFTDSADTVFSLAIYSDTLFAGGRIASSGSTSLKNIAKLNGSEWTSVDDGINGPVYAMEPYRGRLYIGGSFTKADALISRNIVSYNNGKESLGIIDKFKTELHIWPNPTQGTVQIDGLKKDAQILLIDALGNIHASFDGLSDSENSIDLNVAPGTYFIHVILDDRPTQMERVIIY